jgi:predicted small secreted protein
LEGGSTLYEAITMFKKIMLLVAVVALGAPIVLTGCNTMHGVGKDITKAGDKVQQEAKEHTD